MRIINATVQVAAIASVARAYLLRPADGADTDSTNEESRDSALKEEVFHPAATGLTASLSGPAPVNEAGDGDVDAMNLGGIPVATEYKEAREESVGGVSPSKDIDEEEEEEVPAGATPLFGWDGEAAPVAPHVAPEAAHVTVMSVESTAVIRPLSPVPSVDEAASEEYAWDNHGDIFGSDDDDHDEDSAVPPAAKREEELANRYEQNEKDDEEFGLEGYSSLFGDDEEYFDDAATAPVATGESIAVADDNDDPNAVKVIEDEVDHDKAEPVPVTADGAPEGEMLRVEEGAEPDIQVSETMQEGSSTDRDDTPGEATADDARDAAVDEAVGASAYAESTAPDAADPGQADATAVAADGAANDDDAVDADVVDDAGSDADAADEAAAEDVSAADADIADAAATEDGADAVDDAVVDVDSADADAGVDAVATDDVEADATTNDAAVDDAISESVNAAADEGRIPAEINEELEGGLDEAQREHAVKMERIMEEMRAKADAERQRGEGDAMAEEDRKL